MKKTFFIPLLVNLSIPLGGMSSDIYLPSLPSMSTYFHSSDTLIQLTITLFTLGLGFGQLISGPISDAIGRKKLFVFGLALQLLSLFCIVNLNSIYLFIFIRSFQGVGAAFMMVTARAMLNDTFHGTELKKQYTYMTASFALGPIIAPFLGGYLEHYIGWKSNFYFIGIYDLIMLITALFLLEETLLNKKEFSLAHVYKSYANVLSSRFFTSSGIMIGLFFSYMALFNVVGPFLIQKLFEESAIYYGYVALCMGAAWFTGNIISRFLIHTSILLRTKIAFFIMLTNAGIMFLLSFLPIHIYFLILPVLVMMMLGGFLFSTYASECLSLFKEQAASANGLLFSMIWIIFSLFTFIGAVISANSLFPIASCFLGLALLIFLWFKFVVKKA
jgi:multidrug resistance protein